MTRLQILIPMAGRGRRFAEAGYQLPKPFIGVDGKPMVARVLDNLPVCARSITLNALEEHRKLAEALLCRVERILWGANPNGTAATILDLKSQFEPDDPLLVVNADQWLDWSPEHFASYVWRDGCDGAIVTFRALGQKWSYAKFGDDMCVVSVAEKLEISNDATCGVYYWRQARSCFESIGRMIEANRRVNNEFYLCPSFNEMIVDGARVIAYPVPRMWGMGTPADLKATLEVCPWRLP